MTVDNPPEQTLNGFSYNIKAAHTNPSRERPIMNTPSSPQDFKEEFTATIKYPEGDFQFIANKGGLSKSKDLSGRECWTIAAYQDIFKDTIRTGKISDIKEVNSIQLYIADDETSRNVGLVAAEVDLSINDNQKPLAFNMNSGNFFRIIDQIPDENNVIETTIQYPGTSGELHYKWINDPQKCIEGSFDLFVTQPNKSTIKIKGNFKLSTARPHTLKL